MERGNEETREKGEPEKNWKRGTCEMGENGRGNRKKGEHVQRMVPEEKGNTDKRLKRRKGKHEKRRSRGKWGEGNTWKRGRPLEVKNGKKQGCRKTQKRVKRAKERKQGKREHGKRRKRCKGEKRG
jgi:hypothetical protein